MLLVVNGGTYVVASFYVNTIQILWGRRRQMGGQTAGDCGGSNDDTNTIAV